MKIFRTDEQYLCSKNHLELIDEFLEKYKCLYIQSPMGSGKTSIVKEILNRNKKVLMITNRVSLAQEFKERYKNYDINFYKDSIDDSKSLIIQYDSLHKIDINKYDIFILDELMSLLMHSLSLLTPMALFNLTKLYLILETRKIVVLDAFLGKIDLANSIKLINEFREENNFLLYKNRNFLIKTLLETNAKFSVSCSSLLTAKAIFGVLKGVRKPFLYSSETPDDCKIKALNSVKLDYNKYDVFIYTPSITTGIDILSDYEEHFHIDDAGSCDIISSLQMIKRNRVAKKIHCFVRNSIKYNETDVEKLNESVISEIALNNIKNPFLVEIDYSSGNYTLSKVGRFYNKILALKHTLENNRRKQFLELIEMQFKSVSNIDTTFSVNLLENQFKSILRANNDEILNALNKDVNEFNIADLNDKNFQKRLKLQNYITDFFGKTVSNETIEYFLKYPKEFEYARNRELYKGSLKDLKSYKHKRIEAFDFNTAEIDLIISYKKNKFKLSDIFFKKDLSNKDIKFLKLLGYKPKQGKLIMP